MLVALLLVSGAIQVPDSTFATPHVERLVREVAAVNRTVPASLKSFTADIETEAAFILNLSLNAKGSVAGTKAGQTEVAGQVEQFASRLAWSREKGADQRIVGYRSMAGALVPSVKTLLKESWVIPMLYGDTIPLFVGEADTTEKAKKKAEEARADREKRGIAQPPAGASRGRGLINPFALGAERYYRYGGGDTLVTLQLPGQRTAVVVHLTIAPQPGLADSFPRRFLFQGDAWVDAVSHTLVRMRGRGLGVGKRTRGLSVARVLNAAVGFETLAYFDIENRFEGGAFWLPGSQRLEFQASSNVSDARFTIRLYSTWGDYEIVDEPDDTLGTPVARMTLSPRVSEAPTDSISGYGEWQRGLGSITQNTNSYDFDQYAPSWRRPTGEPVVAIQGRRIDEFFHYNRVEGVFLGAGALFKARDAFPGLQVRANLGYAINQETIKGVADAALVRGDWVFSARAGRQIESTNTFGLFTDVNGATIQSLFGRDNHDYVDRYFVGGSFSRAFGVTGQSAFRAEVGWAKDEAVAQTAINAPIGGKTFQANAPATTGSYISTLVSVDWNRNVTGRFAQSGVGGFLTYERGDGDLRFDRLRGRLNVFEVAGPWMFVTRLDGGVVLGSTIPPQFMLRFGGLQGLPGYNFKAFAGNQAVLGRVLVQYNLPFWKKPLPLFGISLPGVQPGIAAGIYSGWSDVDTDGQKVLNTTGWVTTNGVVKTLDLRLRFFGSAFSIGASKPLAPGTNWQFLFAFGDEL